MRDLENHSAHLEDVKRLMRQSKLLNERSKIMREHAGQATLYLINALEMHDLFKRGLSKESSVANGFVRGTDRLILSDNHLSI